jgi:hypothetical protein
MASVEEKLKIGVIGLSEGNGHPYSWSAICNGYDEKYMKECPFPVIPAYLSKEKFPERFLTSVCEVTHIWTQSRSLSEQVSRAAKISHIVDAYQDMIGQVDAVFLARDDAEHHEEMASPFLEAGVPLFIDKPLAYTLSTAARIYKKRKYDWQLFTCSSLRFAKELLFNETDVNTIGEVNYIEAKVPKSWEKYAIHVIEPIVAGFPLRGSLQSVQGKKTGDIHAVSVQWENIHAEIVAYGRYAVPIAITYYGERGWIEKRFDNAFDCFRESIVRFYGQIKSQKNMVSEQETCEIIGIIESYKSHA